MFHGLREERSCYICCGLLDAHARLWLRIRVEVMSSTIATGFKLDRADALVPVVSIRSLRFSANFGFAV